MSKGSKQRPLRVDRKQFESNWERAFGQKRVSTPETISNFFSDNGKKEAVVLLCSAGGYSVELYEGSRYIRTVDCSTKSLQWAEDVAENWTLGVLYE